MALDGVDLDVPGGAFVSVLGPSGSGKTTLLRCIAGFERPDAGTVTLRGRELVSPGRFVRAFERGIGIVPQEGALFPHLTVAQNIGFGLVEAPRRDRRARVGQLLELVGLAGLGGRRPDQLSGGQQQRVALARALAPEPALVLLDEPFSALDAQLRVGLREEVRELLRTLGSTAVLVTHDQAEAISLADHLVVMRGGRVVAAGEPREVYEHPVDADLARFLGEAMVIDGAVFREREDVHADCALGRLPVGHFHGGEGNCQVLIRPEQIVVTAPSRDDSAVARDSQVMGVVASLSYFGHDALLRVEVPGLSRPIVVRVAGRKAFHPGDQVVVSVTRSVATFPAATNSSSMH
ncbi:Fe(3+) ions import ATP-binding protein FbpC [Pseudonocardia sulfidoxydans NBRC 16205]|uniref:ABC-type quaternary amine transporter n=1 Tax=Pseudonocardia sulfidoxydans NBRC 16205 TaxID=1223511 RepID=A0A511DJ93_9PSEU|nr:ABC transporter ATP-binding protein [Pseudonocardia sulfidoxydans]GEL24879.1 Fe(3+) ions import ATP-binding protein FbpC [Pseudonocardia sulfidoxydans NBRC 16205]